MERFGQIVEARRNVWAEAFTVKTGAISFQMKLEPGVNIPSSLTFGRAGFGVSYKGQTCECHNCQGSHMARNCKEQVCYKCRGKGHLAKSCPRGHRCTVCWRVGHQYMYCPEQKKRARVVIGREWSKGLTLLLQFKKIMIIRILIHNFVFAVLAVSVFSLID